VARIALGDGRWFDGTKAKRIKGDYDWNGSNYISVNTGSQWHHQDLYLTAKGVWVKHCCSNISGNLPTWEVISENEALRWLIKNNEDPADFGLDASELEA
jgi:hypothetical protein